MRYIKDGEIKRAEYIKKLKEGPVYAKYTAEELYKIILAELGKDIIGDLELPKYFIEITKMLCLYFTNDPRFEERGYGQLGKSLILWGPLGCGKTSLMKAFRLNQKLSFRWISARGIVNEYQESGHEAIRKYSTMIPSDRAKLQFGQEVIGLCIDDLGTEEIASHFGSTKNVLAEIIMNRDDNLIKYATHFTCNIKMDKIDEIYGPRVRSKIRGICNLISFPEDAKDFRK